MTTTQSSPPAAPTAPVAAPAPAPAAPVATPASPPPTTPATPSAPAAPIAATPSPTPAPAPLANPTPAPSSDDDIRKQLAEVKKMLADAEAARLVAEQKAAAEANKVIEAKLAPKMAQLTAEQKAVVEKLPLDQREAFLGAFLTSANPPAPPSSSPAPAQNATITAAEVIKSANNETFQRFKQQNPKDWAQKLYGTANVVPMNSFTANISDPRTRFGK